MRAEIQLFALVHSQWVKPAAEFQRQFLPSHAFRHHSSKLSIHFVSGIGHNPGRVLCLSATRRDWTRLACNLFESSDCVRSCCTRCPPRALSSGLQISVNLSQTIPPCSILACFRPRRHRLLRTRFANDIYSFSGYLTSVSFYLTTYICL